MADAVIIGACRSPAGGFLGSLSHLSAPRLCSLVIKEALKRSGISPLRIDEVIMGNVISAGLGQNPARQAALKAGLPETVAAFTVNKVCASGLKAVALGAEAIMAGSAELVVAGGMESMSNAPFLLTGMRDRKYGDSAVADAMLHDGLMDCYYGEHMGELCELTVSRYSITRKAQDAFALKSQMNAQSAAKRGYFKDELVPVRIKGHAPVSFDETIRWDTTIEALGRLRPVFKENGTITAGNSPGLNDGAAVLILASKSVAKRLKIKPLASIIGWSSGHLDPRWYTLAPVVSVKKLLKKTGLSIADFDLIEENEAFAAQTLAVIKELRLDRAKVNVNGGAIALGHPIGASGARCLVTLVHALKNRRKKLGLATMCLGGGGAMSMAVRAF
ncbi:MAG: thiolase family protein [Deltaproteobacteria bacterium]|nr:thiolase family protein [Deltaproteobacteria bacterium]